jgi:acyl-CoA hydrolase
VKVGDLVEIESWCKNSGRRGIIIEVPAYLSVVKMIYLDTGESSNPLKDNVKVISESR